MSAEKLIVTASPHIRSQDSVPRIMWHVVASLVPVVVAATWFFGVSALLQIATATIAAVLTERATGKGGAIADGSATITGLLLGLTLPAGLPLWMTALGAAFAIVFGKQVWGGLGQNVFNPALVGRAFLQAAFPVAITTWPSPGGGFFTLHGDLFAMPLTHPMPNAVTSATPLGLLKFEGKGTALTNLVTGNTGGSLGETAALVILAGGVYLAWRGYLNWRTPVSIMLTVMAVSAILHFFDATKPDALFMLFSGGLVLGAVYMATDMVTSPITDLGKWVFGVGIGILVVVIRVWGGLPEGVMYAILFMNALTPFINRATQPRVFGTRLAGAA
ncbi:MAG TPA: RnfABCDGE type electron transport complex subunit D [Gemmatimonadaceae bacterium]|nr:RnfABCDGE type electron transport complex subunit D [Gemmatimonadaceae bacterium]